MSSWYQSSLIAPAGFYYTPPEIRNMAHAFEPQWKGQPNSWRLLKGIKPTTEKMAQALQYWTNRKEHLANPRKQEELLQGVTEEVETLRQMAWKWHVQIVKEEALCLQYHSNASNHVLKDDQMAHLYPQEEGVNLANRKIDGLISIPENFRTLDDYRRLERDDLDKLKEAMKNLPDISTEYTQAKKFWIDGESARELIGSSYTEQYKRLRTLLWKRHLTLEAARERQKLINDELSKKVMTSAKATLTKVGFIAFFFFSGILVIGSLLHSESYCEEEKFRNLSNVTT